MCSLFWGFPRALQARRYEISVYIGSRAQLRERETLVSAVEQKIKEIGCESIGKVLVTDSREGR